MARAREFDHKRMVEDLLRGVALAPAARTLDFATLERLPADYVDDFARGQGDAAWRVRFRGAAGEWLYLLVLLEFHSPWTGIWPSASSPTPRGCI